MGSGNKKPAADYSKTNKDLAMKQSKESGLSYTEVADLQKRFGERESAFDYTDEELATLGSIKGKKADEAALASFRVDAELYKTNKKITEEKEEQDMAKTNALAEASNLSAYAMQRKKRLEMGGRAATTIKPTTITAPTITAKKRSTLIGA
jgi:hypothetical protein